MINNLRKFSKTLFAKVLIAIIIVPFVFWGMGGVFNEGNTNSIAKINNHNISTQDFIDHLNRSQQNNELIKENLNDDMLEELLSRLISETLIKMEIQDLNISFSDKSLFSIIQSNKNFKDKDGKFSRIEYEKFLLTKNTSAIIFEERLRNNQLQRNLFSYISGGIKSPTFLVNKTYVDQSSELIVDFINLENSYKKRDSFTINDLEIFIRENNDQLKEEYIDFSYIKITPQNLTGVNEFTNDYFKKIDELENRILNEESFDSIVTSLKIEPTIKTNINYDTNITEIEKKIYDTRNEAKIKILEENDFYILYSINEIKKIIPNLKEEKFKKKISNYLYEQKKYEFNKKIFDDINNGQFNQTKFNKIGSKLGNKIESATIKSISDDTLFDQNSIKLLYSIQDGQFVLINDKDNNIYLANMKSFIKKEISTNSKDFTKFLNQSNVKMRDNLYNSYDNFLNSKYKVKINEKTLERVKNYFR